MGKAKKHLSGQVVQLLCYALPAIPLATVALPLYVLVPTFYPQNLGLPIAAVGAVLLMIRLLDAASDPLIGWLSDRLFVKSGRRRTFFLLSVPLTALAAFMVFWPPSGAGVGHLAFWGTLLQSAIPARCCLILPGARNWRQTIADARWYRHFAKGLP